MKVIKKVRAMQKLSDAIRREGKSIGLVPTMGALHDGHFSLVKMSKKSCDITVMTIFVNKLQFGKGEDFSKYPKRFDQDKKVAQEAGVDYIFAPEHKELYSDDFLSFVDVKGVTENLCGMSRTDHFSGVATVVAKLFNITKPHKAFFGEKDFQQLVLIKNMVADLNFDIKIHSGKIVREKDGLALSSRNAYLNDDERERATIIYKTLVESKRLFLAGEKNSLKIIKNAVKQIQSKGLDIDYVKIVGIETLKDLKITGDKALMAVAVRIGKTRLIDNIVMKLSK